MRRARARQAPGSDMNEQTRGDEAAPALLLDHVVKTVSAGDSVQLVGFGTFASGNRAERVGRNPRTGEDITIPAAKTVKFSAGKAFKDSLNKK